MMGQLPSQQNELFYDFCLEKHIPEDHVLRHINQFLDFDLLKEHLKPYYSHTGRPSIDPELMIRMLLIGYCYGIRSERRICEEVNFNLAYRWFCKLGLEDDVPDHSSFSKNRHGRFRESDIFRLFFDSVVHSCHQEGLIKGEGFASDASYILADAAWENSVFTEAEFEKRRSNSRAVKEYLNALDDEVPIQKTIPKRISLTDPIARWKKKGGPTRFHYSTNYLIDIENNIIVDVEATPSNNHLEVNSTKLMIQRVEEKYAIKPKRLMADTAYGTGPMLDWIVREKQIEPYIPVWDKEDQNPNTFSYREFIWNKDENTYTCPAGKKLRTGRRNFKKSRKGITKANTIIYRALKSDCDVCEMKLRCTPSDNPRKIARSVFEESREFTRKVLKSKEYEQSFKDRRKVEVLFGHLKRNMNFDRLRLRGLSGANDEFILAATAQNLKKLANMRYKPPNHKRHASVL